MTCIRSLLIFVLLSSESVINVDAFTPAHHLMRRGGSIRKVSTIQDMTYHPSSSSLVLNVAQGSSPNYEDKSVPWTKARLHNSPLFRSGALLLALALAGYSTTPVSAGGPALVKISSKLASSVHILAFGTWFGTVAYTTFILGITMFKELPRKVFGKLQSKLFPKYFNLCAVATLLQLVTLPSISILDSTKAAMNKALLLSLAATLVNLFYLEPTSTKIMFDRYAMEETPGGTGTDKYKKLASNFGKFHGISSLVNLIAFCGAVAQGVYISSFLAV